MDDNRATPMEERALANAIERAATVVSINKDLDCNTVLANQLKKASVDPKFAKTASQAFNKRLTVLTFQKTADEHKADNFPLSDADTVYNLVAGTEAPVIEKAASFDLSVESALDTVMEKAASEEAPAPNLYEKRVSMDTFNEHLECMIDKYASALKELEHIQNKLVDQIDQEADEIATIFKNAHYDYDFTTAVNLYGEQLKEALGDRLDKEASFEQTSKFVIKPQKAIFNKVAKLMEDRENLESITKFEHDYATGLTEFCKSAAQLADDWQMLKVAGPVGNAVNTLRHEDDVLAEMLANQHGTGAWQARSLGALDTGVGLIGAGLESGIKGINDVTGATRAALENARRMYAAGNNVSISPGDLLDASFLTKDRYRDRLLAWSDMSADPQLALYPAEQVFQATNKAMDMDTSLERPDQRELLRTQVAQLLAQNNRVSTADIAALAETLKALSSARPGAVSAADMAVQALGDKAAPERPELDKIVGAFGDTEGLHDLVDAAGKDYDEQTKKLDKIDDTARSEEKERIKEQRGRVDKARENIGKITGQEAKKLLDAIGYHPMISASGAVYFAPNRGVRGGTVNLRDMRTRFNNAITNLRAAGIDLDNEAIQSAREQLRLT